MIITRLRQFFRKYKIIPVLAIIVFALSVGCSGGAENISQPNTTVNQPTTQAIVVTPSPTPTISAPITAVNTVAVPTMAAPVTPVATVAPVPATTVVAPVSAGTPPPVVTAAPAPATTAIPAPAPVATVVPATPTPPPVVASSGANAGSDIPFMVYGTGANSGDTIFILVANNVVEIVTADSQGNWGPVLAVGKKGELITFLLNGNAVEQSAEWEPGGTPQNVQTGFVLTLQQ